MSPMELCQSLDFHRVDQKLYLSAENPKCEQDLWVVVAAVIMGCYENESTSLTDPFHR